MKVTVETITDAQIRELRDTSHTYGDGNPDFVVRICNRALTTVETITDDQIESFVRAQIAEAPHGDKTRWLGMGDEALADPRVGAPYRAYCREKITDAYRIAARTRCADIWNARHGGES